MKDSSALRFVSFPGRVGRSLTSRRLPIEAGLASCFLVDVSDGPMIFERSDSVLELRLCCIICLQSIPDRSVSSRS